jgi:hypothetical protein
MNPSGMLPRFTIDSDIIPDWENVVPQTNKRRCAMNLRTAKKDTALAEYKRAAALYKDLVAELTTLRGQTKECELKLTEIGSAIDRCEAAIVQMERDQQGSAISADD